MNKFINFIFIIIFFQMIKSDYFIQNAFPNLSFNKPVEILHANDESNLLYVLEQAGRIYVFENETYTQEKHEFLDIRKSWNVNYRRFNWNNQW